MRIIFLSIGKNKVAVIFSPHDYSQQPGLSPVQYGIVLRSYLPLKRSCLVFDRLRGMIKISFGMHKKTPAVVNGALLRYTVTEQSGRLFFDEVSLHALPAPWVSEDILFLHHVLEVSEAFLAEEQVDRSILNLLLELHQPIAISCDIELYRIVFLGRLFMTFGIYPEAESSISIRDALRLIYHLEDTTINSERSCRWRTSLICWLKRCVAQHPDARSFKTIGFLK